MALDISALLDPDETFADPLKRQAMADALRKKERYGAIGQLMGVQPTAQVGAGLQDQAQGSLKMAIAKQQEAKEAAARAAERQDAEKWRQMNYDATRGDRAAADADRDAARGITASNAADRDADRAAAADARATATSTKLANQYRGEYDKKRAALQGSTSQAQTLLSLAASPDIASNPQAQTAIVFAFGKMLDPTSTVREGEYKLFEEARGMLDSWGMTPERIASGARLSPAQIKQMVSVASRLNSEAMVRQKALDDFYLDLSTRNKVDPADLGIVQDRPIGGAPPQQGTAQNPIKVGGKPAPAPAAATGTIKVDF